MAEAQEDVRSNPDCTSKAKGQKLSGPREVKPEQKSSMTQISLPSWALSSILQEKEVLKKQETVVNSHQYEINFYWRYWFFFNLFCLHPHMSAKWGMLLFSLVLIYLFGLALSTLISCLLSFQHTSYVTPNSQVIFLPPNAHERHSSCRVSVCCVYQAQPTVGPAYYAAASVASGLPALGAQRE